MKKVVFLLFFFSSFTLIAQKEEVKSNLIQIVPFKYERHSGGTANLKFTPKFNTGVYFQKRVKSIRLWAETGIVSRKLEEKHNYDYRAYKLSDFLEFNLMSGVYNQQQIFPNKFQTMFLFNEIGAFYSYLRYSATLGNRNYFTNLPIELSKSHSIIGYVQRIGIGYQSQDNLSIRLQSTLRIGAGTQKDLLTNKKVIKSSTALSLVEISMGYLF